MSGLISGLFSLRGRRDGEPIDYKEAKRQAADADGRVRRRLARRTNVEPEILYFLAEDPDPEVRREIAANAATPVQADELLAADADEAVRCHVAAKIGRLAPELSDDERARAGALVVGILETLARDHAAHVRRVLAEELKSARNVPVTVIEGLARDPEILVAGPVLGNSPLLDDEFLIEIIRSGPVRDALRAISGRDRLGAAVSDAIVATDDRDAITDLLRNSSAQIREETLDRLVERATDIDDWHEPLVARPALSARAASTLARFVTEALLARLHARKDLPPEVAARIGDTLRRRIERAGPHGDASPTESAADRAQRMFESQGLGPSQVRVAMMKGERAFVTEAVALLAGLPASVVHKAFSLATAKGVAAICWKAGLPAELATQLQLRVARIPPKEAIQPRDGGAYPLPEKDMAWQLEFLGG